MTAVNKLYTEIHTEIIFSVIENSGDAFLLNIIKRFYFQLKLIKC